MTDTIDGDDDIRAALQGRGDDPTDGFRADLRARLASAIDGDVELEPSRARRAGRVPTWFPILAAAAVVALLIGAIVVVSRGRDRDVAPVTVPPTTVPSDLAEQLAGTTWVALDTPLLPQVPLIEFTRADDGRLVLSGTAGDGCNDISGPFELDDDGVIVSDEIATTAMYCGPEVIAELGRAGVRLSIDATGLTVDDGTRTTIYTALASLTPLERAGLDGEWELHDAWFSIVDGRVASPFEVGGPVDSIARALDDGELRAWSLHDDVLVQIGTSAWRLTPHPGPPVATLLDQLVGTTWVGVGGSWRTHAPTLLFDSLNSRPGLSAVSADDGCNAGGGTFRLDGDAMVDTEIAGDAAACDHQVAALGDGTTLTVDAGTLTVTSGGVSTTYVSIASLEPVQDVALDGKWEIGGATFSIAGDTASSANSTEELAGLVGGLAAAAPVDGWRYGDGGYVVQVGERYLVLLPSDQPYGVIPVVTTGAVTDPTAPTTAETAEISGVVELDRGCLVVTNDSGSRPVVWPAGTAWDVPSSNVVLVGGRYLTPGESIVAGGGYHPVADLAPRFGVSAEGVAIIASCAERLGDEVAVIQGAVTVDDADLVARSTITSYLDHLAAGDDEAAAALLQSSAIEDERRSDLRELLAVGTRGGGLAATLSAWCNDIAVCTDRTPLVKAGPGVYAATFQDGDRVLTAYFRAGTYEGVPEVRGVPPLRPAAGDVTPCPTERVERWIHADLDGDGIAETVVSRELSPGSHELVVCNTTLDVAPFQFDSPNDALLVDAIDTDGDGADELLAGGTSGTGVVLSLFGAGEGALVDLDVNVSTGVAGDGTGTSFGCEVTPADSDLGAGQHLVTYEYRFVGGTTVDDSTGVDVTMRVPGGGPVITERSYAFPGELDAFAAIADPTCNARPVLTD